MSRANFSSTFLEFEMRHQTPFPGEATGDAYRASGLSTSACWPPGRQTGYSKHRLWRSRWRRILTSAIDAVILQNGRTIGWPLGPSVGCSLGRLGWVIVLAANTALADREPAECIAAHTTAQELADSGKLLAARKMFESCSASDCPKLIQKDCKVLGRAVEQSIPTLNLTAVDHNGQALTDFRIELDGVAQSPDSSHQLALDPGEHRVKLVVSGRKAAEATIPVRSKQKNQSAVIQLAAPDAGSSKARTAGYVLAGIGAVGLVSFVGFGWSGYLDQRKLDPNSARIDDCTDLTLADRMRRKYVIADVSLGIGLVSLGAATYLLLATRDTVGRASPGARTAMYLHGSADGGAIVVRSEF